jgi:hypothetical protein
MRTLLLFVALGIAQFAFGKHEFVSGHSMNGRVKTN